MASDPSQFAPLPTLVQSAVNRRLMSQNAQPLTQSNSVQQPATQAFKPSPDDPIPLPVANHPYNSGVTPAGAPSNPLIGGTGDPTLDGYLGTDTTYQSQLSDLMRQFDQYNSQKGLTASQTQADYDAKQRSLSDQAQKDQLNIKNTAAAHGILYSGIYANDLGQYNRQNQQAVTNLLGGFQNSQDNAAMAYNQFVANELAAKQNAIQAAAQRRAIQLGTF